MRKIILFVSIIFIMSCAEKPAPQVELLTVEQMKELLSTDSVQLVDVRTPREYQAGHLEGAHNITYLGEDWDNEIASLDKSKPVVVYCQKGGRSGKCSKLLQEAGFQKIYDLDGGLEKWKFEGQKVVKNE